MRIYSLIQFLVGCKRMTSSGRVNQLEVSLDVHLNNLPELHWRNRNCMRRRPNSGLRIFDLLDLSRNLLGPGQFSIITGGLLYPGLPMMMLNKDGGYSCMLDLNCSSCSNCIEDLKSNRSKNSNCTIDYDNCMRQKYKRFRRQNVFDPLARIISFFQFLLPQQQWRTKP